MDGVATVLDTDTLEALSDDDLEAGICGFAARLAAATCVWVLAVGEFDRREVWAGWGCRSMAHWLTWKCAMSPSAAREHVRVAASLADLPRLRAGFRAGRLSYSQVRAVSRVATAATETDFIDLARSMTAAQLESVVRGYRRCTPPGSGDDPARSPSGRRSLTYHTDDDGFLVGSFRLPADVGGVVVKALEVAAESLHADAAAATDRPDGGVDAVWDRWGAAHADALTEIADTYLTHMSGCGTGTGAAGDERFLVTVIAERRILTDQHQHHDGPSDGADTGASAGASAGVGAGAGAGAGVGVGGRGGADADGRGALDGVCHVDGGGGLDPATVACLLCDQPSVTVTEDQHGHVLDVGRRTRRINRRLRRALEHRDRHCQYPGCATRVRTHAHHLRHWMDGGPTNLDNLLLLCAHHHRRHHEGLYRIDRAPSGGHRFTRADGQPIQPVANLAGHHGAADPGVTPSVEHCTPDWDGGRLNDLSWVVGSLLNNHGIVNDSLPADYPPPPDPCHHPHTANGQGAAARAPHGSVTTQMRGPVPGRHPPTPDERDRWPDPWHTDDPPTPWPGE